MARLERGEEGEEGEDGQLGVGSRDNDAHPLPVKLASEHTVSCCLLFLS